ncbi:hypothetical protein [Streptomyces sp. NBRC 109706]|uniref:hypothetical protein n=1 Tax=Streptomyces sp. NBRC 109706 TaxID=1550035 RepID=UPI000781FC39|nr:hypothetical protein [Streptomyces sp. NBRC 109706]
MGASIVAALAALSGVGITTLTQGLRDRSGLRRAARERDRRLVADLLAAVRAHRAQQYLKIADRREGVADSREARAERYAARSAMFDALDDVVLLIADAEVVAAAQVAVDAAVAIGDLPNTVPDYEIELAAAGGRAREAHTHLRQTAASNI